MDYERVLEEVLSGEDKGTIAKRHDCTCMLLDYLPIAKGLGYIVWNAFKSQRLTLGQLAMLSQAGLTVLKWELMENMGILADSAFRIVRQGEHPELVAIVISPVGQVVYHITRPSTIDDLKEFVNKQYGTSRGHTFLIAVTERR